MKTQTVPEIFGYVQYRFYLRDYYEFMKRSTRYFSYRYFAKKAGLSASLFKDILSGRQNLSLKVMEKYAAAMNLKPRETEYFRVLVGFENAKSNFEKNKYFGEMVHLRGRSAISFLQVNQYEYFSQWYHSVVRELLVQQKFNGDPIAIAKAIHPKVTEAQVRKSILLLESLGLVARDENQKWAQTSKVVSSEYQIQSMALKNYHASMIQLAGEALDRFGADHREFQGITFSGSRELFERIKHRLRGFRDEILNMSAEEKIEPEGVFQLNLNLFPFTQTEKGVDDEQ